MKGKATFTLTDARTGKIVKQVTEHNMVTDAARRILNPPAYLLANCFSYSTFLKNVLPLYKNIFGGIALLGNTLEERADNVVPGKDCQFVATAGSAYAGTNVCRGTLNENESYVTENGYHFTWDFGTDKANGTIKCVALTSRSFGDSGIKAEDKSSYFITDPAPTSSVNMLNTQVIKALGQYIGTFQKNTLTYYKRDQLTDELEFVRIKCIDPSSVKITDSTGLSAYKEPSFSATVKLPFVTPYTYRYYDPDKKLMFFFSSVNTADGASSISYAGIDMEDLTIKEQGEYALDYPYNRVSSAAFYGGKFFIAASRGVEVYSAPGVVEKNLLQRYNNDTCFYNMDGLLLFCCSDNVYLYVNGGFLPIYSNCSKFPQPSVDVKPPYIMLCEPERLCSKDTTSENAYLAMISSYFATINDLSEPIVKTSEHTLKITYDITN